MQRLLLLLLLLVGLRPSFSQTNSQDVAALQALMSNWQNGPRSWTASTDPCSSWDGISCSNARVIEVRLPCMNLQGTLSNTIGQLSALTYLDLSGNLNLEGPLTPKIGDLKQLTVLILLGCSFNGNIPREIGNLSQLTFLALNSNNFSGGIPPTLGLASNLFWLDMSVNQLSGQIPVSPGLNQLIKARHFHFSENQLTGPMSESLFKAKMNLTHALFNNNNFTGPIPASIGQVTSLKIVQLDHNQFSGPVPESIGNLSNLLELNLANNLLNGTVPDLTTAPKLNCVDLNKNNFPSLRAPGWFSTLTSLNRLDQLVGTKHFHFADNQLSGPISESLFSANMTLIHVYFQKNKFTGTIPESLGLVQTLQMIMLNENQFSGSVPKSIGNLRNLTEMNLASNLLSGMVPDLSDATQLNYLDLSNNNFASSPTLGWFSTLTSLNTLLMDNDGLTGTIPSALFSLPQLQQVSLANNALNGTVSMRSNISPQLRVVNLTNNQIADANVDTGYNISLILTGNPICLHDTSICKLKQHQQEPGTCGSISCPHSQSANPAASQNSASTSRPSQGSMIFIVLIMYTLL